VNSNPLKIIRNYPWQRSIPGIRGRSVGGKKEVEKRGLSGYIGMDPMKKKEPRFNEGF
jgi:hypothetical protein